MNNKEWLKDIIEKAKRGDFTEGCYYTKENEEGLCIVIGWEKGYEKEDGLVQIETDKDIWTLVGKVAYNCDDLQCDFDIDWYEPWTQDGDVYCTCMAIKDENDIDYFETELEYETEEIKNGNLLKS